MKESNRRDQANGRYVHKDLALLCACDHTLGRHAATTVASLRDCFEPDCRCERFRKAREKGMTKGEAQDVLDRLKVFDALERKATDEAGWIALAYSCSRLKASRKIARAREILKVEAGGGQ